MINILFSRKKDFTQKLMNKIKVKIDNNKNPDKI